MLGCYLNFPSTVHGLARFSYSFSTKRLQEAILSAFNQLNKESCSLNTITPSKLECEVSLELGVAESVTFSYLDKEELDRLQKHVKKEALPVLDFLCVVRYYVVKDKGKRVPLKFDYHIIRFLFGEKTAELQVYHERGTQRVPIEDMINFIAKRINGELSRKRLRPLAPSYLWTL